MKKDQDRGAISHYDLKKPFNKIMYGIMVLLLILMVVTMLYPILSTFFNGFKGRVEVNSFPPHFFPHHWHFENFKEAWTYIPLLLYLRNTLLIFIGDMAVTIIVLGFASYSLSKLNVPYKKYIFYFFLMTMFIPPTTYIIPNFVNLKDLGLMNTFFAFWLPAGSNAFFMLLLKTFFDDIDDALFDAARIDGASELRCYFQIAFPLSVPIFATLSIFVFAEAWNDWFWPSLILHSSNLYPLSTAIYKYVINARMLDKNVQFAILSMILIPPIIVFLLFQKYIVRGLHLGGVKG